MTQAQQNIAENNVTDKQNTSSQVHWYVINCYSGNEDRVCEDLQQRIDSFKLHNYIFDVRVVKEKVLITKTKKIQEKNVYPGYVFVKMIMSDEAWYVVRNTPGVTGFIGSSGKGMKPFPLSHREVKKMLTRAHKLDDNKQKEKVIHSVDFNIGDKIKLLKGPFEGHEGTVTQIDNVRGTCKFTVEFFGRLVEAESTFDVCEKTEV